jgi:hypothetical protein
VRDGHQGEEAPAEEGSRRTRRRGEAVYCEEDLDSMFSELDSSSGDDKGGPSGRRSRTPAKRRRQSPAADDGGRAEEPPRRRVRGAAQGARNPTPPGALRALGGRKGRSSGKRRGGRGV